MMQKIQRFGGAMFTPVLLFAFAGVVVGVGTLCTTEATIGPIATEGTLWRKCWNIILEGRCSLPSRCPSALRASNRRAAAWRRSSATSRSATS